MMNPTQQEREMDLEDLITSRSGDVLRLKAKADAAMPEMAKVRRYLHEASVVQLALLGNPLLTEGMGK